MLRKTNILMLLLVIVCLLCSVSAVHSSDIHIDTCDLIPMICNSIYPDHSNGWCDNTDGIGQAYPDIDCRDYNSKSSRSWETSCEQEGTANEYCQARATVLCPGFNPNSQYVTFWCYAGGIGAVKSGVIGYDSEGRPMKGVYCNSGSPVSCGCTVTGVNSSVPFGNHFQESSTVYQCQ